MGLMNDAAEGHLMLLKLSSMPFIAIPTSGPA
jgi:hypothetical protein